jgi:hypothetical protein
MPESPSHCEVKHVDEVMDESWEASTIDRAGVCWTVGRRKCAAFSPAALDDGQTLELDAHHIPKPGTTANSVSSHPTCLSARV